MTKNFAIFKLKGEINEKAKQEFYNLKNDKFLKTKWIFRKRSYAKAKILKSKIIWLQGTKFFQSKKNHLYILIINIYTCYCIKIYLKKIKIN